MASLIEMSINSMENGMKVRVFSSAVESVLLKEWIVRDLDEACDTLEMIVAEIRKSKKTKHILEHKIKQF